jgi:hypothetical protein
MRTGLESMRGWMQRFSQGRRHSLRAAAPSVAPTPTGDGPAILATEAEPPAEAEFATNAETEPATDAEAELTAEAESVHDADAEEPAAVQRRHLSRS